MVVIDIETKDFFSKVYDSYQPGDLEVSFVGAYDSDKGKYLSFWENELSELEKLLVKSDLVIGYNVWQFDYGVLNEYFNISPYSFPTIDLMAAMKKAVGFWPKLDDLARANFGTGKIGKGSDAGEYWRKGQLDKLEKYCLEDVRLTYEVWKKGEETGSVKYFNKQGFPRETGVNWQDGFFQRKGKEESTQVGLL